MKNAAYLYSLLMCICVTGCTSTASKTESEVTETPVAVTLTQVWETDTTLATPESVIFDEKNNIFYVSCIGAVPPTAKDGDGYIAKMDTDGKITDAKWVTGLDAPKGLALVGNILYVADITHVVMIDITTGKITGKKEVAGAVMLNDMDAAPDGTVYFTDSGTNKVYSLKGDDMVEMFTNGDQLKKPNGVFVDGNNLMIAGMDSGNFVEYSLTDKKAVTKVDSLFGGDGVEKYRDDYFVSNWNGEVYHLTADWKKTKLIDTKEQKLNAADIEIVESKNLLLVPTFFGNKVVAYKINN